MKSFRFLLDVVLPELATRKGLVAVSVTLLVVSNASALLGVEATRGLLALAALSDEPGGSDYWVTALLDGWGYAHRESQLAILSIAALVVPLATYVLMYIRDYVFELIAIATTRRLRSRLYVHLLALDYLEVISFDRPSAVKRIAEDAARVRDIVVEGILMRVTDILLILAFGTYLFFLDAFLASLVAGVGSFYLVAAWVSAQFSRQAMRAADDAYESMISVVTEGLRRIIDIRCFARESLEIGKAEASFRSEAANQKRMVRVLLADRNVTNYLAVAGPALVLVVGSHLVFSNEVPLSTLIMFVIVTALLYQPVNNLSALPILLRRVDVGLQNIQATLSLPSTPIANSECSFKDHSVPIEAHGVRFEYAGERGELRFTDFVLDHGQIGVIQGPSGIGKSTILRLLFGLLRPRSGTVSIFGINLSHIGVAGMRQIAVLLPQDPLLFEGTVADNIAYGARQGEVPTKGQVLAAADSAGLGHDYRQWSEGLEKIVAPGGENLSGGQKKRIALARALLRGPRLLLLDEPLEGVSGVERSRIVQDISRLRDRCAILIATHQDDVAALADRRFEMCNGSTPTSVWIECREVPASCASIA